MTDRQLPKWSELKPLLRPKPVELERHASAGWPRR